MNKRPAWFDATIVGGVFTTTLLAASAHMGFIFFLLNLVAVGLIAYSLVTAVKDGDLESEK